MDTATIRDIAQVVPAVALAAAGQVAAAALGQCARLLDEHGSSANLLARHAARNAAYYTGDLSQQVAENAHVYASRAAYQAQRQVQRVHSITDTLASVIEATVQTATSTAQRTARRQANRAATFADDQAVAASYAMQSLVGRLPGFVPRDRNASSNAADFFDPWADIPPRSNAASVANNAAASVPYTATSAATCNSNMQATAAPSNPVNMQGGCTVQHPQHLSHSVSASPAAAAATPAVAITELQADLTATQEVLADTVAALEDAHIQLAVKQITANMFRSVERNATEEQLQQLHKALLQSSADLAAARQQLAAATDTVAALPQQMVCMVQNQMRRAMREGMVELVREALASPEPTMHSAAAAAVSVGGTDMTTAGFEAHAGYSLGFAVPAGPGSVTDAQGQSPTAMAEAAADAADDVARTAADQAAALLQLGHASGLSALYSDAGVPTAMSAVSNSAQGTESLADEDQKCSDGDAFVMVDAAIDSN